MSSNNGTAAGMSGSDHWVVSCKDKSMYGKKMKDLHMAGVKVLSEEMVRSRERHGKVHSKTLFEIPWSLLN